MPAAFYFFLSVEHDVMKGMMALQGNDCSLEATVPWRGSSEPFIQTKFVSVYPINIPELESESDTVRVKCLVQEHKTVNATIASPSLRENHILLLKHLFLQLIVQTQFCARVMQGISVYC